MDTQTNFYVYYLALYDFIIWVLFLCVAFGLRYITIRMDVFRSRLFINLLSVVYVFVVYGFIIFYMDPDRALREVTGPLLISASATFLLMTSVDYFQNS